MALESNQTNLTEKEYKELPIIKNRDPKKRIIIGYLKIDNEDYDTHKDLIIFLRRGYPTVTINKKPYFIHRLIMKATKEQLVDHIYHDLLDCRKKNLRIVSYLENNQNLKINPRNTTGYRGVSKRPNGYEATVEYKDQAYFCGIYDEAKDAAQAAANKRAELGMLDKGILPTIIPIEHKKKITKGSIIRRIKGSY